MSRSPYPGAACEQRRPAKCMRPRSKTPTAQELEILKIVWQLRQATVGNVCQALRTRRPIAYTTVLTMMRVMTAKGYLRHRIQGRAYVYRAAHPRSRTLRRIALDLVRRAFDGSAEALVDRLLEAQLLSARDLSRIARKARAPK